MKEIGQLRQFLHYWRSDIIINYCAARAIRLRHVFIERERSDQFQFMLETIGFDRLFILRAAKLVCDAVKMLYSKPSRERRDAPGSLKRTIVGFEDYEHGVSVSDCAPAHVFD